MTADMYLKDLYLGLHTPVVLQLYGLAFTSATHNCSVIDFLKALETHLNG